MNSIKKLLMNILVDISVIAVVSFLVYMIYDYVLAPKIEILNHLGYVQIFGILIIIKLIANLTKDVKKE